VALFPRAHPQALGSSSTISALSPPAALSIPTLHPQHTSSSMRKCKLLAISQVTAHLGYIFTMYKNIAEKTIEDNRETYCLL